MWRGLTRRSEIGKGSESESESESEGEEEGK